VLIRAKGRIPKIAQQHQRIRKRGGGFGKDGTKKGGRRKSHPAHAFAAAPSSVLVNGLLIGAVHLNTAHSPPAKGTLLSAPLTKKAFLTYNAIAKDGEGAEKNLYEKKRFFGVFSMKWGGVCHSQDRQLKRWGNHHHLRRGEERQMSQN